MQNRPIDAPVIRLAAFLALLAFRGAAEADRYGMDELESSNASAVSILVTAAGTALLLYALHRRNQTVVDSAEARAWGWVMAIGAAIAALGLSID